MRLDVATVEQAFAPDHVQQGIEEHDIGAGTDREVQVGGLRRGGAARIHHHQLHAGARGARVLDAAEHDGMGERRVRAGDQDEIRMVDVLVAARRRVHAERELVAGDRGGHAQPRVGVHVVGADQPFGELVENVVILGQELSRDVERDAIRPVPRNALREAPRGVIEGLVPVDAPARIAAARAQLGMKQARRLAGREMQSGALGAQPAEIGGMVGIAAHPGDARAIGLDDDAAADAAIAAGGADFAILHEAFYPDRAVVHAHGKYRDADAGVLQALPRSQAEVLLVHG